MRKSCHRWYYTAQTVVYNKGPDDIFHNKMIERGYAKCKRLNVEELSAAWRENFDF